MTQILDNRAPARLLSDQLRVGPESHQVQIVAFCNQPELGGPVYWRTPSKKVDYCSECHENYDRGLGGVPVAQRITALP